MPNRYIREDAIESEPVNDLSWQAEVFWRRLLNRVDDFGRFPAHPELLRASLFPLQLVKVSAQDVDRLLKECEEKGLLFTYTVGGKRLLVMNKWEKGRAKESKHAEPPANICERMQTYVYIRKHMSPTPTPIPTPIPTHLTPLPPSPPPSNPEASAGASLVQNEASAVVVSPEASKTPEDGKAAQGGGSKKRVTPMQIPTLEEVKLHALKIGLPENEAQKFYGYYESNGWRVGKNPMRSWTGAMTNWKGNYDERRTGPAGAHHGRADGNPPAIRSEAGMAGIDAWRDDFKREADNHVNDDLPFA